MDSYQLEDGVAEAAFDIGQDLEDPDFESYQQPKHPIDIGTKKKPDIVPKLHLEDGEGAGMLYIEPIDVRGMYDFTIDVESMAVTADDERKQARQAAVSLLSTNENVVTMLAQEQVKPKFKELFITWLEDLGFVDAERFFEQIESQPGGVQQMLGEAAAGAAPQGGAGGAPGSVPSGIPGGTNPNVGGEASQATPFTQKVSQGAPNAGMGPISPKSLK